MPKAQLFITCLGDQFYTHTLKNMVALLEHLGVDLEFPPQQTCCGQPLYNNGFEDQARGIARSLIQSFGIRPDLPIISPSGSCAAMIRHHYPLLFPPGAAGHELAMDVSSRVYDFSEYLIRVLGVTDLQAVFPHRATYHASCHSLREMGLRTEVKSLLNAVRDLELIPLEEEETCCGFGGAFSVTFPEVSRSMMEAKVRHIASSGAEYVVVTEPGCLMNIAGELRRAASPVKAVHIIDLLAAGIGVGT